MKEIKNNNFYIIDHTDTKPAEVSTPHFLKKEDLAMVQKVHQALSLYEETPLVQLRDLAGKLGLKEIFVKDESKRFGLNAFKGLGGIYALTCIICKELGLNIEETSFEELKMPIYAKEIQKMVFVTATDGNHGRGVSWAAGLLGCAAHIYMPVLSSEVRAQAIRDVNPNAHVTIMDVNYDDAVRHASKMATENGWHLVQDTSWDGYEEVPTWIMQGYTTMAQEACSRLEQLELVPTHVLVQAGVGSMAASVVAYIRDYFQGNSQDCAPRFILVEPENNACFYESARIGDGLPHESAYQDFTIMAGLNCGEPCTIAWPILRDCTDYFVKCSDLVTESGMRTLANPVGNDSAIISGESGAVSLGLIEMIARDGQYQDLKEVLGLNQDSVILCFSTEGDMDPESYHNIINKIDCKSNCTPDQKPISKVTLIGLGAMGAYFAPRLYQSLGENFRILASGARKERLETTGITINSETYHFPIIEPDYVGDEADLIIMAVKDLGLEQAILDIRNQIGPHTQILCVMNGIDSENQLIKAYGQEHVLHSFMRVSIVMVDGVTNYDPSIGAIYFGEVTNAETHTPRVDAIAKLFTACEIPYRIPQDMIYSMWFKFMCNIGENLTCALLGVPFGAFRTSDNANFIRIAAMREVIAIANALDINLSELDIQKQESAVRNIPFANKPSTLQDLEAYRKTEIHMFAGRVMELGKELGIPTPINELFYYGIRTLEEKPFN